MKELAKRFNEETLNLADSYYNGLISYDEWDATYRKMEREYEEEAERMK